MSKRAVVVLGHGSRSAEAREQFTSIVEGLVQRVPGTPVFEGSMELAEPSFDSAVASAIATGATEIVVVPCFLYAGIHIKSDIPEMLAALEEEHPGVSFTMRDPIGADPRIVEVLLERLGWESDPVWGERGPEEIEAESMRVIDASLAGFADHGERAVARRLIHASGALSLQPAVDIAPGAVEAGLAALRAGMPVVTDVRMVASGIDTKRLSALGGQTACRIDDPDVARLAREERVTRSSVAMRELAPTIDGAVVAIGNAPTALREVIALHRAGVATPALVVGIPVGFVDAAESKEALRESGLPYITVVGARGGSPLAAAAVNALLRLAEERD